MSQFDTLWPSTTEEARNQVIVVNKEERRMASFKPGEVVTLEFPQSCSACIQTKGNHELHDGVRVKNITDLPDGWHGYWWCPAHWDRYTKNTETSARRQSPADKAGLIAWHAAEITRLSAELRAQLVCPVHNLQLPISGVCDDC